MPDDDDIFFPPTTAPAEEPATLTVDRVRELFRKLNAAPEGVAYTHTVMGQPDEVKLIGRQLEADGFNIRIIESRYAPQGTAYVCNEEALEALLAHVVKPEFTFYATSEVSWRHTQAFNEDVLRQARERNQFVRIVNIA